MLIELSGLHTGQHSVRVGSFACCAGDCRNEWGKDRICCMSGVGPKHDAEFHFTTRTLRWIVT